MSEFVMPSLGADMEAGTLVEWLKKPGDAVKRGDVMAVVETQKGEIEIVISDLTLGEGTDGFKLLELARKSDWGRNLPWVFVATTAGGADAKRAFDLGAGDFLTKPVKADLLVAKIRQVLEREATRGGAKRGVSGSLTEMSLPDMVQVLWHGRKTGSLKIRSPGGAGEIHFVNGAVYTVAFHPDGSLFAAGGFDGKVRLHDAASGGLLLEALPVPLGPADVSRTF